MTRLTCGEDREGEEGHKDNTGNKCKSSVKGEKNHQFAIFINSQ